MIIYTTTENFTLTENFSDPILPENPIRYSRKNDEVLLFAPVAFLLAIFIIYILDNLYRGFLKCINNRKRNNQKKEKNDKNQRSKFVVDMECNECKHCAGKLFCKHKITRIV